jgi:hypothetical protein
MSLVAFWSRDMSCILAIRVAVKVILLVSGILAVVFGALAWIPGAELLKAFGDDPIIH